MNQSNKAAGETLALVAVLIFGGVGLFLIAHMALFLLYSAPSDMVGLYRLGHGPVFDLVFDLFQFLLRPGHHEAVLLARLFSAICAVVTLMLVFRLATHWSGDAPSGAALTLGFVLFPVATYAFALALPYAPLALVFILSLVLIAKAQSKEANALLVTAGVLSANLPFIHSAGAALFAIVIGAAFLERRSGRGFAWFLCATGLTAALIFGLTLSDDRSSLIITSKARGAEALVPIFQGYAMIWVAQVFSIIALAGSRALRVRLGAQGVYRSVAFLIGSCVATISLIFVPIPAEENLNIAFSGVLVVGVLASLPMVMWIRLIMPKVRSVAIWIALPVIMYSCFWVVLGPIDLDGFPYDQLTGESVFSASH